MFFPFLPPLAIQAISCAIPYFIPIFYSFSLLLQSKRQKNKLQSKANNQSEQKRDTRHQS